MFLRLTVNKCWSFFGEDVHVVIVNDVDLEDIDSSLTENMLAIFANQSVGANRGNGCPPKSWDRSYGTRERLVLLGYPCWSIVQNKLSP